MIYPRIVITEDDFRDLVAGKQIDQSTGDNIVVQAILQDIGWDRMEKAIEDAKRERMPQNDGQTGT